MKLTPLVYQEVERAVLRGRLTGGERRRSFGVVTSGEGEAVHFVSGVVMVMAAVRNSKGLMIFAAGEEERLRGCRYRGLRVWVEDQRRMGLLERR